MELGGASGATEHIAEILDKYPGGIKLVDSIEILVSWARANSLWPLIYGTACCAMEMMSAGSSRHDWARFGVEVARATPRQADLIVLAGTIVEKMGPNLITLYEQMPAPKYVIAMGSCAISGGPFYYDTYSVIKGGDRLIPVDVYVPGCPPRPEALLYGIMELQEKIKKEGRRNPWKIGKINNSPIIDSHTEIKTQWAAMEKEKDQAQKLVRKKFKTDNPLYKPAKTKRLEKEKFEKIVRIPKTDEKQINRHLFTTIRQNFPNLTLFRQQEISPENVTEIGPEYILDFEVSLDDYLNLVSFLKNEPEINMDMILQLTAVDWLSHFDILVQLLSTTHGHKIFLRCSLSKQKPAIETISFLYPGAQWHEREVYDLFGITFTNHPDLRRIFLNNDFPGHPLRKDFEDPTRVVKKPY